MRKAGDIVSALFREKFGPEFMETARYTAGLFSSWARIVADVWSRPGDSPAVAAHSQIRELERGVLLVEADHPGWIQILQTKQGELLAAVQRRYPEQDIRGLAFRLSREPFSPPGPTDPINTTDVPGSLDEVPLRNAPRDEEFYVALKGLEESIKKRNGL